MTKDWINLAVLIRTAIKTKRVKKIINAKRNGDISISPKETMKKLGKNIKSYMILYKLILNQRNIKNKYS